MLAELNSHKEKMFQLVTERITALSAAEETLARARKTAVETTGLEHKLAAFDEAMKQLHEMRMVVDAERREALTWKARLNTALSWVKPLVNGFGHSKQFSKQGWDGFQVVLDYLSPEQRKAIRATEVQEDELTADNFTPDPAEDDLSFILSGVRPFKFEYLHRWMLDSKVYPKQGSPLHNRFKDDVFPQIEAAVLAKEEALSARLKAMFDVKFKLVQELTASSK